METIEETITPILIFEEKKWIREKSANVDNLCHFLNEINRSFPIESPSQIPSDPERWVFKKFLEESETARSMHQVSPLSIDKINLPAHLTYLLGMMKRWQTIDKSLIEFAVKIETGFFEVDLERLENHLDKNARKYVTRVEQIQRLEMAIAYDKFVTGLKIDGTTRFQKWTTPMTAWHRSPDANSFFPNINLHWVTTGEVV